MSAQAQDEGTDPGLVPTPAQWASREAVLARLLPDGDAPDRDALLGHLTRYAREVVAAARTAPQADGRESSLVPLPAWLDQPVFVCGAHRSGTTLMQRLLDGHPDLVVLPSEGTYFSSFDYVAHRAPSAAQVDRFLADWVARFVDPNFSPHFRLGRSDAHGNPSVQFCQRALRWQAALRAGRPELAPYTMLLALVLAFRDVADPDSRPRMWVEKTPFNELNLRRLRVFRQARYIHLVRDPAATLASLRAAHREAGMLRFDARRQIAAIGRSLDRAQRFPQDLKERYLVVRYEDLTAAPDRTMQQVRAFLGIAPHAALLRPTAGGEAVQGNSSFERAAAGMIIPSSAAARLPPADALAISALIGRQARAFGYAVTPVPRHTCLAIQLQQLLRF